MEEDTFDSEDDPMDALTTKLALNLNIHSDDSESSDLDQREPADTPDLDNPETPPIWATVPDESHPERQHSTTKPWKDNGEVVASPNKVEGNVLVFPANFPKHYLDVIKKINRVNVQMDSEAPDTAIIQRLVTGISQYFDEHKDARHPHNCTCTHHLRQDFKYLFESEQPGIQVTAVSTPGTPRTFHAALVPDTVPPSAPAPAPAPSRPHIILPSTSPTPIIRQDEPPPAPKALGLLYYMPFLGHLSAVAAYFLLGFLLVSTVGMTGLLVNMRLRGIEEKVVRAAAVRKQSVMRVDV
ncbi:hypothetical protein PSACC_03544 [Paramicrosporidium saccamoebae]|uniref:Uncharacterized protein n=1 Tax=Paramicrosporidium saccamoebae TaxID=1246581 RepID=A0A2H9TFQ5_9FUNG|nr:hypothetical protein PSACC_03544 [Paramicrosporidium saccamoebae]